MEYLEINHNLLSAYIDDDVSEEERFLVELAIENEPQIAWEVATLQQTVSMLNSLSESDYLFTKSQKRALLESSLVKSAPVKLDRQNKIQYKNSGKLGTTNSRIGLNSNITKKSHRASNAIQSLHKKFNLAQQTFWQLGSPLWRTIAIIGLLLLLLLLGSDLLLSLVPHFKIFLIKAQYTTQLSISTMQLTSTTMGWGIHRTYLLIIYLIISVLTFMSTMLWWRSNPYH